MGRSLKKGPYVDEKLLIKIEQTGQGDLYVCHDPFLGGLMKKGLGRRGWTLAVMNISPNLSTRHRW